MTVTSLPWCSISSPAFFGPMKYVDVVQSKFNSTGEVKPTGTVSPLQKGHEVRGSRFARRWLTAWRWREFGRLPLKRNRTR